MKLADVGFSRYELGKTAAIACQADQRFSYCLYVPESFSMEDSGSFQTLIAIHGSDRGNAAVRDQFISLAEELKIIVIAPLFPAGIIQPYEMDNYKYVVFEGIRYDELIISMVQEVGARYDVNVDRFAMFGFSGGAHLAHRFLYLHPSHLRAVSICAPGSPTLLDFQQDWWVGVRDASDRFGIEVEPTKIANVAIHLAVGLDDLDTSEITHQEGGPHWREEANKSGKTRVDRLRSLSSSFAEHGIRFQADYLEDVGHSRDEMIKVASAFFRTKIRRTGE